VCLQKCVARFDQPGTLVAYQRREPTPAAGLVDVVEDPVRQHLGRHRLQ
jgi:hypothetical protein